MGFLRFLILSLCSFHVLAQDYPPVTADMQLTPVSERVFYVQGKAGIATDNEGFISNAAVVITDEGVVVVDALGSPSLAQRLLQLIREITDQPVKKLIVTHYHADHIYGVQVFKELGAEVIAPAGFTAYLDSDLALRRLEERRISLYPWVNEETRLVRPDHVVAEDERFSLGGVDFLINYLGSAHSDGDLSVLVESDGVLISGDIIFEGRVPFTGSADTAHWLETLEHLSASRLSALVPGHGPAAADPNGAIQLTLSYLRYLHRQMGEAVEAMVPFDEAYGATDWSAFSALPAFEATNRRNAYGVYLSLEAAHFQ